MSAVPSITLNNGVQIPQLGYGVFKIPLAETQQAVETAFEVGYRHIDTAEAYGNEQAVGAAVRASGLDRSEVFVTSKLRNRAHEAGAARTAVGQTLDDLDLGYVDLFLIHWPTPGVGDYVETWRQMEQFQATGLVRAIGVSNFEPAHLTRVLTEADAVPAVNQIELHPYLRQDAVRQFDAANGIATEAWSPIARGGVLSDPVIVGIAERINRTPAQVTLRWSIQLGNIVIPKSVHLDRMRENLGAFDFELSDADMEAICELDRGERIGPDPNTYAVQS